MGQILCGNDPALFALLCRAGVHISTKPWHAFVHAFASHYGMAAGNLAALQRYLGNHSAQQTMAYVQRAYDFAPADLARRSFHSAVPAQVSAFPKRPRQAARYPTSRQTSQRGARRPSQAVRARWINASHRDHTEADRSRRRQRALGAKVPAGQACIVGADGLSGCSP